MDRIVDKGTDVLVMEGTTLRENEQPGKEPDQETIPEPLLTERVSECLSQTPGPGVFNIYLRDVEKIGGMIRAARQAGPETGSGTRVGFCGTLVPGRCGVRNL